MTSVTIPEIDLDLIRRAKAATDLGVTLGAFAQSVGKSYNDIKELLDKYDVRYERRTILTLPPELAA